MIRDALSENDTFFFSISANKLLNPSVEKSARITSIPKSA
jgi:hypothetical protein